MKKILITVLLFIGLLTFNNPVKAVESNPLFLLDTEINRFSYLNDYDDNAIELDLTFMFYDDPELTSYFITIEQVNYEGTYLRFLYQKDIYNYIYDDLPNENLFDLNYDFNNIVLIDNIAFYQIRYGDIIIWTGAVMQRPDLYPIDTNSIEVGDYVYNDTTDYTYPNERSPMTYNLNENYMILHYRFDDVYVAYDSFYIKFHDLNNLVVANSIDFRYILECQMYYDSDSLDYEITRNQFVILPLDNIHPPFLMTDDDDINNTYDNVITYFGEGVYSAVLTDDGDNLISSSYLPLAVVEGYVDCFDLSTYNGNSFNVDDSITVTFIKNSSIIASAYETSYIYDNSFDNISYDGTDVTTPDNLNIETVDAEDRDVSITYQISEDAVAGQIVTISWKLVAKQLPYSGMSIGNYSIYVTESYSIEEPENFDASVDNLLDDYSLNYDVGYVIILIVLIVLIDLLIGYFTTSLSIFAFVDLMIIVLFILIGWINLWISVTLGLVCIIGLIYSFKSGGGD